MVFERFPVESKAFVFFAFSALSFLVEASLGFVSEPFAVEHLLAKIWKLEIAAFVKPGG